MRRILSSVAVVGLLTSLLVLSLAGAASAEIRTGTATDPSGDSSSPSLDFISLSASYDSNGVARVTATMNGPVTGGFFSFGMASYAPPSECTGATLSMFGTAGSENLFIMTGVKGVGSYPASVSGNTVTFGASDKLIAGKDFSCVRATVSSEGGIRDELNVPLWFADFGPDTDGDGVKDSSGDQCPTESGPAPTGCPLPETGPKKGAGSGAGGCRAPKLKGKTLANAKKAIKAAGCTLGTITKSKAKKGVRLVVVKQTKNGSRISVKLGKQKSRVKR